MASLYREVAILVASATLRQSISQNLALTVVVKLTQSLTKVRGVLPVTSSHWARVVPPKNETKGKCKLGNNWNQGRCQCGVLNQNKKPSSECRKI